VGPDSFNALPMCRANSVHQCDVVTDPANANVSPEMHLRYAAQEGGESSSEIDIEWREISKEPALEVYDPLAIDVIRNENATDPLIKEEKESKYEGSIAIHISRGVTS